jgi:hypothetical protein
MKRLPEHGFNRESIVNSAKAEPEQAGLLACNIFIVLPTPIDRGSEHRMMKILVLLTVARQLPVFTGFPINPA